ncbi:hypothetical protein [Dysgonomonas sp. 511]|uniref:hypothetical protein n=1 Tax=Dysgonomonas sp. 511 TaxID=2302930 RepID=UPI0013D7BE8F|nr:hypothetical protein [Dysgonomonas sp. 511]
MEVNGYKANRSTGQSYLDKVYNPVGVTWEVDSNPFSYEGDLSDMFKEGSKLLSAYNDKMKALQNAYKEKHSVESGTTYLFILGKSGGSEAGFMPRGKQFGYIFTDKLSEDKVCHNIAHELGHGKWKLSHTFDSTYGSVFGEKDTDNLMSYSGGNHLAKWQWDVINDPAWFSNPLDGDDKGASISIDAVTESVHNAGFTISGHNSFMTPSGQIITLPTDYETVSFTSSFPNYIPNGALTKFKINGKTWLGYYDSNFKEFLGYVAESASDSDKKVFYEDIYTKDSKPQDVILGFADNCHIILKSYSVKGVNLPKESKIKEMDYFKKLRADIIGNPILDDEACSANSNNYLINTLDECSKKSITINNPKYSDTPLDIPYRPKWSDKHRDANVNFWYMIDRDGYAENPELLGVKRPVYVAINSPMTLNAKLDIVTSGYKTEYTDEIYQTGFITYKALKNDNYDLEHYVDVVQKWKNVHYKPTTDPSLQAVENITALATAMMKNGTINPMKVCKIDKNKLYSDGNLYYNGEEMSYYLFGYIANKYLNFAHVTFGQAFAMQYLNAASYDPTTDQMLEDVPWLIKAFNNGWAKANGLDAGFLTDGLGMDDVIEATLWVYAGGAARKITVKLAKNALATAYINWQVQILIRMICDHMTFDEAAKNIDYQDVAWYGLTSMLSSDKELMALNCIRAGVNRFQKTKELDMTLVQTCVIELIQYKGLKKLFGDEKSIYGKKIYELLKKRNHSKSELLRHICIVFNCNSDRALEILRLIPDVAFNTLADESKK